MGSMPSSNIEARVSVVPVKSQVFLITLSLMAFASLVCSYFSRENNISWAFLAFSAACIMGALWAWKHGQSDIDLDQGHPTTIALPNGTSFSTDSRILRRPEGLESLTKMLESVLHRKPLPEPSGLVNEKHEVIADSQSVAIDNVNKLNGNNQQLANKLVDELNRSAGDGLVTQTSSSNAIPPNRNS